MGLKVNFSKNEAASEPRSIVVPITGEYPCRVVDIVFKTVNPGSKNVGKPYWNVKFIIQGGTYADASIFSNIMLFEGEDGTLGSLAQFLKALGYDVSEGEFELPEPDELIGKELNIFGRKLTGPDKKTGRDLPDRFQISSYKKSNVAVKTGEASLLP